MGLLTKIEETISRNAAATLLAGAAFSSLCRAALAGDGPPTISPSLPAVAAAPFQVQAKPVAPLESYAPVRSIDEIGKVWLPSTNVYIDSSLIGGRITGEELVKLGEAISKEFPNWTIYIASQKEASRANTPISLQASAEGRLRVLQDRLAKRSDFTSQSDRNLMVINVDHKDPSKIAAVVKVGSSFRAQGIGQDYWNSHFAKELSQNVKTSTAEVTADIGGVVFSSAVLSDPVVIALKDFDGALSQKVKAAEAEKISKQLSTENRIVKLQSDALARFGEIQQEFAQKIPEQTPAILKGQEDTLKAHFQDALRLIKENEATKAQVEVDRAFAQLRELKKAAHSVDMVLSSYASYGDYVAKAPSLWFLDAPGRQAIKDASQTLPELREKVIGLSLTPQRALDTIADHQQALVRDISSDQAPEEIALLAGGIAGPVALGLLAIALPRALRRLKEQSEQKRREGERLALLREQAVGELDLVENSLSQKQSILEDLLIQEPYIPGPECEKSAKDPDFREVAIQAWWILKKMNAVLAEARNLSKEPATADFEEIHELLHDTRFLIVDDDGLNFLPEIKKWRAEMAAADVMSFRAPSLTFQQLSKRLVEYVKRAVELGNVQ